MVNISDLIQIKNASAILSNIGNKIIENQNILKLLKYPTSNALLQTNVTSDEIIDLVGMGIDPSNQKRIFKYGFSNIIIDEERTELRFFIPKFTPNNIYLSSLQVNFQIIVYNRIIDLDGNQERYLVMVEELLNSLNGLSCGGIGLLYLTSSINYVPWNQHFSGYTFSMSTRTV